MEFLNAETIKLLNELFGEYWTHGLLVLGGVIVVAKRYPDKWNILLTLFKLGDAKTAKSRQAAGAKEPGMTIIATNGTARAFNSRLGELEKDVAVIKSSNKTILKRLDNAEADHKKSMKTLHEIKGFIQNRR